MSAKASKDARHLLLKEYRAALSTHSKSMPGYPVRFGCALLPG